MRASLMGAPALVLLAMLIAMRVQASEASGTTKGTSTGLPFGSPFDAALIQQRSLSPVNALFGLPPAASRPLQRREWQVSLEHGNSFMGGNEAGEFLGLDGETTELSLRFAQRLSACWQASANASMVAHSGGVFDRAIDDWHQWFQLPDAGRDAFPFHDLDYTYVNADGQGSSLTSATQGVGDVQLSLQRILPCLSGAETGRSSRRDASILRMGIKLPTGDRDRWLGSGRLDAWIDVQSPLWTVASRLDIGTTAGILLVGEVEDLAEPEPLVAFGSFGLQYRVLPRLGLLTQIDWHTAFFDSELRELGILAASLSAGLRYLTRTGQVFELSIIEDAVVDTSPDIVARLGVTWRR